MFQQLHALLGTANGKYLSILRTGHCVNDFYLKTLEGSTHTEGGL